MRISKKYAGKGIGKSFFIPNTAKSSGQDGGDANSAVEDDMKKLRQYEKDFHKMVLDEKLPSQYGSIKVS